MEVGGRGRLLDIPIATLSPATTMIPALKMGSDESHFNVSVGSDRRSHRTVSTTTIFLKRKESRSGIEPRRCSDREFPFSKGTLLPTRDLVLVVEIGETLDLKKQNKNFIILK